MLLINESLINGKHGQTVLSICAIPELHEMEGLANHILYNGIYPKFGNEIIDGILKDMDIKVIFLWGKPQWQQFQNTAGQSPCAPYRRGQGDYNLLWMP